MATLALENPASTTALTENQFAMQWESPVTTSAAFTEPREQAYTFASKASAYRVVLRNEVLPAWVKPTILAFVRIQNLTDGWDSYGGKATNRDLIKQSIFILGQIMQPDSPAPSVVPIGDGGIQMEWHRRQQDLEIVLAADDAPQFYYKNRATGTEQEGFANELANLTRLLINLA